LADGPWLRQNTCMLTQLHIQNFKAWKDTKPIRMAPLTVIFGANSSGKSSLGHLLLALKQTAALADRKRSLHLGDAASLIDLGSFADCFLAAQADGRKINRRPKGKTQTFDVFMADWLKTLKVIHSFQVVPVAAGRKDYEVLIQTHAQAALVKLTDQRPRPMRQAVVVDTNVILVANGKHPHRHESKETPGMMKKIRGGQYAH
jgi:hypothetical protein